VNDDRARRIGENETLYRAVNERIEGLNEAFGHVTETMTVVCECGDIECTQQIEISVPDYERVRSDPTLFVIVPGHEIQDVEDVMERHDAFHVVSKHRGKPARIAEERDPRS
jgi:recombinational DNA repair protein RecR